MEKITRIKNLIIGGGVSGLTAAIYTAQAKIETIVLEGPKPGGALAQSHCVNNWPGKYQQPGSKIVDDIKSQAIFSGADIRSEICESIAFDEYPYRVVTDKNQYLAYNIILAMGREPNYLDIPGEKKYWGSRISNCAVCDGLNFKNKKVLVIGGGDSAFVEADYLSSLCQSVTILVRSNQLKAKEQSFVSRVLKKPNVNILMGTKLLHFNGFDKGSTLNILKCTETTCIMDKIEADGVFLAIGAKPNTKLLTQLNGPSPQLESDGCIMIDVNQQTSIPHVYACGDICDSKYVQAIISASQGCQAALNSLKYLNEIPISSSELKPSFTYNEKLINNQSNTINNPVSNQLNEKIPIFKQLDDLKKYIENNQLTFVMVSSEYCLPCKRMIPILNRLDHDNLKFCQFYLSNETADDEFLCDPDHSQTILPKFFIYNNNNKTQKYLKRSVTDLPNEEDLRNFIENNQ